MKTCRKNIKHNVRAYYKSLDVIYSLIGGGISFLVHVIDDVTANNLGSS